MSLERLTDEPDCGCAPTELERRSLWPTATFNRRKALTFGAIGAVSLGALGAASGPFAPAAFAIAGYPSWADVEAARANEASKAAEVSRIQGLIAQLQGEVARTQAEAEARSQEYYDAQQAFFLAAYEAEQLQAQADAKATEATDAANRAGRVAAQLYRSGGEDAPLELFFAGSAASADDLLARLGTMDKLIERNQSVYAQAVTARDASTQLSANAKTARDERDRLQKVAEEKMFAAQQAADAAQAALAEQEANQQTLQAQLAALQDATAKTVAGYQAGVEEERRREAARRAAEAAAAEQRAREAAAAAAAAAAAGGGGGGGNGGAVVGSGWSRPSSGWRSSGYGPRTVQCGTGYCSSGFHAGVDLAAGCWAGIFAANSGTVTYAGYNGGYGNYVRIDHGGGIATGYGHIANGGIGVSRGQWVGSGQRIASEGNTGNSFGCHCHFEVYRNGATVNPIDFMRSVGISV